MRTITYKFKVGDYVKFKDHYSSSASCNLFDLAGTIAKVVECADFNGPAYMLECLEDEWFKEGCFAGLATADEIAAYDNEVAWAYTLQGPETKCDTGDSGEFLDSDRCRELYLKALKKTYGKVPFETETVEVGSLFEFTEAVLKATKEV